MMTNNAKASMSLAVVLSTVALSSTVLAMPSSASSLTEGIPKFDHQIVIMMENHSYDQIIGSQYTPYINQLANTYNLATNYYGTTHPSLPNYLDVISGSNFGNGAPFDTKNGTTPDPSLGNDNPPCVSIGHFAGSTNCDPTINSPSIVDQLTAKGLTWKTYQENLPTDKFAANSNTNGVNDKLYAVKHNPFMYFNTVNSDPNQLKNVVGYSGVDGLLADFAPNALKGSVPNFSFIAPNQCHDMHGDPNGGCPSGNTLTVDANEQNLLKAGDSEVKSLVEMIQSSPMWKQGNNVIYIAWDENDYGIESNKVPLIAITNNGLLGVKDGEYANHYSLLRTIEDGFGITDYLNGAQTAHPLTSMVAVPNPSMDFGIVTVTVLFSASFLGKKRTAKLALKK